MKSELTKIPGIGVKMAEHLIQAGYPTIASLKGQSPDDVYAADCLTLGLAEGELDRCVLYTYRLAVEYANHDGKLPADKQNWWDWKD